MKWDVLDTAAASAEENMRLDSQLLASLGGRRAPVLHFYEWKRESATYGYFVRPEEVLNFKGVERRGLDIARRPTGGGVVFHIWDWAFSVLVPAGCEFFSSNTLENYAFVNRAVLEAVKDFFNSEPVLIAKDKEALDASCARFCMARPTKYDVVLEGGKVAGAAQRKTKEGFLHQGTIALTLPDWEYLDEVLKEGTKVREAMQLSTRPLLGEAASQNDVREAKEELKRRLQKALS